MSNTEQAAFDAGAAELRRQQALLLLQGMQDSFAQMRVFFKLVQAQREQCSAFVKMIEPLDTEQRELYADQVSQWAAWSRSRAEMMANLVQDLSAIRQSVSAFRESLQDRARAARSEAPHPPWVGEVLICLLVPLDRQDDRLGDFAERFQVTWLPRCGPRLAGVVYVAQVLWSAAVMAKIRVAAAIVDFLASMFDW